MKIGGYSENLIEIFTALRPELQLRNNGPSFVRNPAVGCGKRRRGSSPVCIYVFTLRFPVCPVYLDPLELNYEACA